MLGAALLGAPGVAHAAPVRAQLGQAGESLVASVRTSRPVALAGLERQPSPRRHDSSYLCFELSRASGTGRRICLGGAGNPHRRVGLERFDRAGRTTAKRVIAATVKRRGARKLTVTLDPASAGLAPHRYRWRVIEAAKSCRARRGCAESLPGQGYRAFRLRPVRAVGCTGGSAGLVTNGPRDRNVVALTFDDGPSSYTPGFLDVLRDKHAVGTFFEIGQEIPGRESTMRRILREGNEIGNHTMHHGFYPGYSEIAPDSSLIESATHFRPCLFRPPGGGINSSVIGTAGGLGMRTITWDVDPSDWSTPGSGAVYSRVVGAAQAGSIILMHDGGGNRSGTLAALPSIIDTLRSRGYRFATVSELLGEQIVYRPYG